jgi:phosphatidylglycerophosphate synthase
MYLVHAGPHIGEAPLWFLAMIIAGLLVAAGLRARVVRWFPEPAPQFQTADAVGAACAVLLIYLATSLLRNVDLLWATAVIYAAALLSWSVLDRTRAGFCLGLLVSLAAGAEMLSVRLGLIGYAEGINVLFGVAPWLPGLYFAIGVAVNVVEGAIARSPGAKAGEAARAPAN